MSQKKNKRLRNQVIEVTSQLSKVTFGVRDILKGNWKFLVLVCLGIIAVYLNSLKGDFVSDDYASITQNPNIYDTMHYLKSMSLPGMVTHIIAKLFGIGSSLPYHAASLVLYLAICVLAFIFMVTVAGKQIARISAVLFAFHPIHVEAVSWISGRPYLLTTFLVLICLISMILYMGGRKRKKYLYVVFISMVLNFINDPFRGFALYLLVMLIFFSFGDKFFPGIKLGRFFLYFMVVLIVTFAIVWPLAKTRISVVNGGYNASESVFYQPWFQYPTAITKYLQLLFIPVDLTLYHTLFILPLWLNWAVIILYLGSLVYFWFKNKLVFFALAFVFVASSPSMLPVKVSWLVAERYVFFGSVGFCLLLGIVINNIFVKNKWVGISILGLVAGIYFFRTYFRNVDWQTNHKLWVSTCQVSPNSHNAWNNIGDDYDKLGQYDNAIKGFTQSTVVKPNYADAYHNRANIFFKTGRLDLARDSYNTALGYSSGLFQTYMSLIQIDLMEKRADLAIQDSQKLLNLQPNNPQAWYVTGVVFANVGDRENAKMAFKNALTIMPGFTQAQQALIQLLGGS
ncbi:MAG: tetratricopeptide repeat protein [Candidatus Shapirobacteria bacterium]